MSYRIIIERRAEKEIRKLKANLRERIIKRIFDLAKEPRPTGCRKLMVLDGFRIRIGDYRVLYSINDTQNNVTIFRVMKREKGYK